MKKRNWMNKLSNRAMGMMAAMALMDDRYDSLISAVCGF